MSDVIVIEQHDIVVVDNTSETVVASVGTQSTLVSSVGTQGAVGATGPAGTTGPQGPPGIQGPPGEVITYKHTQTNAAAIWTVNHNLNKNVQAFLWSVGGLVIEGDVLQLDSNTLRVQFNNPVAGFATVQ